MSELNSKDLALFCAILNFQDKEVEKALQSGGDANAVWKGGKTPIMIAAKMASYDCPQHEKAINILRSLLNHGADRAVLDDNSHMASDYALADSTHFQEVINIMYAADDPEETARQVVDTILRDSFGIDNTPSTVDSERELRQQLHYIKKKPLIGANARRARYLEQQLKHISGSSNPNEPVRPSWLGDDDIDKESHFGIDTIHLWHKTHPHDQEMARKSRELREYEKMKELSKNRFNFDEDNDPQDEWFQAIKHKLKK